MHKFYVTLFTGLAMAFGCKAQLTLDYCCERAGENYPLIKKYKLVENTAAISLSDINKGWLPRVGVFAQATVQNSVSAFPEFLNNLVHQNGVDVAGMSKFQYKAGVELQQTIWDGGASKSRRTIERVTEDVSKAGIDVDMYAINERVENIFFGILLLENQISCVESTLKVLESNFARVSSMVKNGTAIPGDADMIEANILELKRQQTEARTTLEAYRSILGIYINENIGEKSLVAPDAKMPTDMQSARPELSLFDKQIKLYEAQREAIESTLMPKVGFFAQGYYGYPGFNIFKGIMKRTPTFNALAGVNLSWNIDSFYTKKNSNNKIRTAIDETLNNREVFLFNSKINAQRETAGIDALKEVMKDDARIVQLRKNVREAAESQLRNGIIDMTALLTKINDENQAQLTASLHEVQLLQNIYKLKYTLNQ